MSLNFDFSKTAFIKEEGGIWADATDQWGGNHLWPDLNALVWGGMAVGLGQITEANVQVWIDRIELYEQVRGVIQHEWREGHPQYGQSAFNPDTVRRCVGMTLNVAYESKAKFLARLTKGKQLGR